MDTNVLDYALKVRNSFNNNYNKCLAYTWEQVKRVEQGMAYLD